jgi:pyruvate formate lyase activating enzyme
MDKPMPLERLRNCAYPAKYWEPIEGGGRARCRLCPRGCAIGEGALGFCGVRGVLDGKLWSFIYARPSSIAVDPIEKKPLYHFHPGSLCLSLGTIGCNFHCEHCQNCGISMARADGAGMALLERKPITPEELVKICRSHGAGGIAFTYNEPSIWAEYILDVFAHFKAHTGFYTALVTNGFISREPLEDLLKLTGAYRVDLKSAVPERLQQIAQWNRPQDVLDSIALAATRGVHVEIVTNLVTGWNDSEGELREMARLLAQAVPLDTPWHFTRYFPRHNYSEPPTEMAKLRHAVAIAREVGFQFIYMGNVPEDSDTLCPVCGETLITRYGYSAQALIKQPRCPKCGSAVKSLVL